MILVDTNILSTFSKIGKLELLYKVFNTNCLYISPNVHNELLRAKKKDYKFVADIFDLVDSKKLRRVSLTSEEKLKISTIPKSFSMGEKDSIVVCRERKGVIATNERKVITYCKKEGVVYFDLIDILRALYQFLNYSKEEINNLMGEIERKDNIIFKDKNIFY